MTEAEWLGCSDPEPMLECLREKVSSRKLWLFTVWCCRSIWRHMKDRRCRKMVEVTERVLEGRAGEAELLAAYHAATAVFEDTPENTVGRHITLVASVVAVNDAAEATAVADYVAGVVAHVAVYPDDSIDATPEREADYAAQVQAEQARQSRVLRCVVGNPFRTVAPHPAWRAGAVRSVCRAAYTKRTLPAGELDEARLGVLADALEDAGCADADLLGHLRSPGPHTRGCWPIDAILDRR